MPQHELYKWEEISKIPHEPGIYSWYYSPEITEKDLSTATERVHTLVASDRKEEAREYISGFLEKFVFGYFKEDPYNVLISASLKPQYKGFIEHSFSSSHSLISRLIEEPERLSTIKEVLDQAAPYFASPIYIGMSDRVGARLMTHKGLIEQYRDQRISGDTAQNKEYSFAQQVCVRNMPPTSLFVMVRFINSAQKVYVDAENILNRINYPILGRN